MIRHGVDEADIAKGLGISDRTFRNKISGRTEFGVKQAIKIRDNFSLAWMLNISSEMI